MEANHDTRFDNEFLAMKPKVQTPKLKINWTSAEI